jgi:hypothetical protein
MPLGTRLFTAVPFPKEATMSDRRTENDYESEDLLMNDDFELEDGVDDDLQEEKAARSRSFNMDMRHRIEDRLEERSSTLAGSEGRDEKGLLYSRWCREKTGSPIN